MTSKIEKNEKNVALVQLEIEKTDFEKGLEAAYQKNKDQFSADGFRKGKVPRKIIENKYGKNIFYEDAIDEAFPAAYNKCLEEHAFKPSASPKLISVDEVGEDGAKLTVEISLEPVFDLADYKNIKVGSINYELNDEDLQAQIDKLIDQNSRLVTVDGPAGENDTATINFDGFLDGVPFAGGSGEAYPLVLGSGTFIPGFEDQLIGKKKGDLVDVNVTFPEEYQSADLAGKEALFKVVIMDVKRKELPELDDEFAKDLGYDDLDALKNDLKDKLIQSKNDELKNQAKQQIVDTIVENTQIDIPPQMLKERAEHLKQDYEGRLNSSGIDPAMYYQYILDSMEDKDPAYFDKMFAIEAEKDIKTQLISSKIIELEEIVPTDEDMEKGYEKYAGATKLSVDEFKETLNEYIINYIKDVVAQDLMFDFLLENADIK